MTKREKNKIQIDSEDHVILHKILKNYPYKFYIYGSRSRGYATKYSDIDIFCKEKVKEEDLIDIRAQLEESNITIKADIIDKNSCTEKFVKNIEKDFVELK